MSSRADCLLSVFLICPILATLSGCGDSGSAAPVVTSAAPNGGPPPVGGYGNTNGGGDNGYGAYGGTSSGDQSETNNGYGDGYGGQDPYASQSSSGGGYGNPDEGIGPRPANGDQDGYSDPYAQPTSTGNGEDAMARTDGYAQAGGGGMYAAQIEPLLRQHCLRCHGTDKPKADLDLSTAAAVQGAGIIQVSKADDSELYIRVSLPRGERGRMPPQGPGLSEEEIALIKTWIDQGASFGGGGGNEGGYAGYGGYGGGEANPNDGYEDTDPRVTPQAPPKNLAEAASRAFQQGDDLLAMNQLYAQSLVSGDEAAKVLAEYGWVPGLKRPRIAVRWGIGVKYFAKGGFEGAPRPIGVDQDIPGLDRDEGAESLDEPVDFRNELLDYYAAKVADEISIRLQNRINRGDYGDILREELAKKLAGPRDDEDEFGDRSDPYSSGGIGRASRGSGDGYGGYGGGGGSDTSSEKPENQIAQLMPGVTVLGEASQAHLLQTAADHGIDLLLVLDIVVDRNFKARLVTNSTKVRLFDVAAEEQLAVTGALRNVDVQRELAEDPDNNPIIHEMDKVFDVVDASYQVKPFPNNAREEHAIKLVKSLLAAHTSNPLWQLSEVRFYQSRGLLKDEHVASAFRRIFPEQAAKLTDALSEDDVKAVFAEWLRPQAARSATEDGERGDDEFGEDGGNGPSTRRREFR